MQHLSSPEEPAAPKMTELAAFVLRDAKEVMRAEFALAKGELGVHLRALARSVVAAMAAALLLNAALLASTAAVILAFRDRAAAGFGAAIALAVTGVGTLVWARKALGAPSAKPHNGAMHE